MAVPVPTSGLGGTPPTAIGTAAFGEPALPPTDESLSAATDAHWYELAGVYATIESALEQASADNRTVLRTLQSQAGRLLQQHASLNNDVLGAIVGEIESTLNAATERHTSATAAASTPPAALGVTVDGAGFGGQGLVQASTTGATGIPTGTGVGRVYGQPIAGYAGYYYYSPVNGSPPRWRIPTPGGGSTITNQGPSPTPLPPELPPEQPPQPPQPPEQPPQPPVAPPRRTTPVGGQGGVQPYIPIETGPYIPPIDAQPISGGRIPPIGVVGVHHIPVQGGPIRREPIAPIRPIRPTPQPPVIPPSQGGGQGQLPPLPGQPIRINPVGGPGKLPVGPGKRPPRVPVGNIPGLPTPVHLPIQPIIKVPGKGGNMPPITGVGRTGKPVSSPIRRGGVRPIGIGPILGIPKGPPSSRGGGLPGSGPVGGGGSTVPIQSNGTQPIPPIPPITIPVSTTSPPYIPPITSLPGSGGSGVNPPGGGGGGGYLPPLPPGSGGGGTIPPTNPPGNPPGGGGGNPVPPKVPPYIPPLPPGPPYGGGNYVPIVSGNTPVTVQCPAPVIQCPPVYVQCDKCSDDDDGSGGAGRKVEVDPWNSPTEWAFGDVDESWRAKVSAYYGQYFSQIAQSGDVYDDWYTIMQDINDAGQ